MTAFDRDNLQLIFSALVDWWLRKFSYSQNIGKLAKGLVGAWQDLMLFMLLSLQPPVLSNMSCACFVPAACCKLFYHVQCTAHYQ